MDGAVAEQGGRGGENAQGEQAREHEQAAPRRGDLGQGAQADDRPCKPEVGCEEEAGERLGAMVLRGNVGDGGHGALEHQAAAGTHNKIAGQEHAKARRGQPHRHSKQAEPGEQRRDGRSQHLSRGT